jgi:hypothetical protein
MAAGLGSLNAKTKLKSPYPSVVGKLYTSFWRRLHPAAKDRGMRTIDILLQIGMALGVTTLIRASALGGQHVSK